MKALVYEEYSPENDFEKILKLKEIDDGPGFFRRGPSGNHYSTCYLGILITNQSYLFHRFLHLAFSYLLQKKSLQARHTKPSYQ